jgi:hypothetical protein
LKFLAPLLALSACAKGCESPAPETPPSVTDAGLVKADNPNRLPIERELDLQLPDRRGGAILPGLQMLPFRRLTGFEANKNLVARVDTHGLRILEREVLDERLQFDEAITTTLRMGAQDYRERAGLEPNRLVLAVDAGVSSELTTRIRRLALKASQWRVVALARDGDQLVELSLSPPPDRRNTAAPTEPTPTAP